MARVEEPRCESCGCPESAHFADCAHECNGTRADGTPCTCVLFWPSPFRAERSVSVSALRARYPAVTWRAVRAGFGWEYHGSDGSVVRACSALAPRYDGDDDSFRTEWWRYFRNGHAPVRVSG